MGYNKKRHSSLYSTPTHCNIHFIQAILSQVSNAYNLQGLGLLIRMQSRYASYSDSVGC